jgi:hypothetical protein
MEVDAGAFEASSFMSIDVVYFLPPPKDEGRYSHKFKRRYSYPGDFLSSPSLPLLYLERFAKVQGSYFIRSQKIISYRG